MEHGITKKLFGTDGVRGIANTELTPELAFALGRAGATVLAASRRTVIVGRDTRLSGSMLEAAIIAGITSVGRDVVSIGIVPTPAVATVTVSEGAAAGVMISASHNPIADNGIKFFGPDGFKLSDDVEREIEKLVENENLPRPTGAEIGVARVAQNLAKDYYQKLYAAAGPSRRTLKGAPQDDKERPGDKGELGDEGEKPFEGIEVVVDAAFGAAYAIAPYVLRKLGATVHELHAENDGSRINVNCGATDMRSLQEKVREFIAQGHDRVVGVAFDGDADRALFIDETGEIVSGDHVMFAIGCDLHERGELAGDTIVGTVMSNIGFERALERHGIALLRAPVGDRYVLERMRAEKYILGGEQSGHIIDLRYNTTGDGPLTAVTLLSILARKKARLHDLVSEIVLAPQILVNIRTERKDVLQLPEIVTEIRSAESALSGRGRLLIRPSGTEPLIRVMAEGDDRDEIEGVARGLAGAIERTAAQMLRD